MKSLAGQPWLGIWSTWEGERQSHGLSIFLRVSTSVQREGGLKGSGERAKTTERGKDVGEERGLGDRSRQDSELSLRTLDRTWGFLIFYSFLFAQVGAQACLLTPHLCLSGLVLDFISRCEAAVPLTRSTRTGTVCPRHWHCWRQHWCGQGRASQHQRPCLLHLLLMPGLHETLSTRLER